MQRHSASSYGRQDAAVTLVLFSDFECPYSARAAKVVNRIKKEYGEAVHIIFRHFPLNFHKNAPLAAQASLAAATQGKFWKYHDLLFANMRALKRRHLEKYAKRLKLNMRTFRASLDNETYKPAVTRDMAIGKEAFVSGTPTLFLNGKRVRNATSYPAIKKEIDPILMKALDR